MKLPSTYQGDNTSNNDNSCVIALGAADITSGLPVLIYDFIFGCNGISGCPAPSLLRPKALDVDQLKREVGWLEDRVFGLYSNSTIPPGSSPSSSVCSVNMAHFPPYFLQAILANLLTGLRWQVWKVRFSHSSIPGRDCQGHGSGNRAWLGIEAEVSSSFAYLHVLVFALVPAADASCVPLTAWPLFPSGIFQWQFSRRQSGSYASFFFSFFRCFSFASQP